MVETQRFVVGYEDPTTNVDFDKDKEKRYNKNHHVLKRILQVVELCAEQGLPLRGPRGNCTEGFTRDGNFIAILKGFAKIDLVLNDHRRNSPKNSQMNSWKIQNQVIACIADVVRRHIQYVLDNSKFFSVIADEVTYRYVNKEILLLCLRYVKLLQEKSTIQETFLDSVHTQGRPTGATIENHIFNILLKH